MNSSTTFEEKKSETVISNKENKFKKLKLEKTEKTHIEYFFFFIFLSGTLSIFQNYIYIYIYDHWKYDIYISLRQATEAS